MQSFWLILSVFTVFFAFALSTQSPLALVLPVCYVLPCLLSRQRMERDSANIWALRLLIYAAFAALGRTSAASPTFFYDARAFTTAGLIIGGEIVLQSFRQQPKGLRFDPILVFLTGILFLIACNTRAPHIWFFAPVYIFFTLMALGDARPVATAKPARSWAGKIGAVGLATGLGALAHYEIWSYQSTILSLSSRLLSRASLQTQGASVGDNPELQSSFNANASTARLLRITGSLNDPHLRTAAFQEYNRGAWGPTISDSLKRPIISALPRETREEDPQNPIQNRTDSNAIITVLRPTGGVVFAPLNAYALVPKDGTSMDWYRFAGPLRIDEEPPFNYGIVQSKTDIEGTQTTQGPLCVAPDATQRKALLEVPPEIAPEVLQLGRKITANAPTQSEKVARIVEYLLKNHKYSLTFQRGNGEPISDFLLEKRAGHCQYFASSSTILLRIAGIPARYATGFYAHETADDGTTIVRGRDAHAWSEAFLEGVGWINVEATPPSGRADPFASPLPFHQRWLEWLSDNFTRLRAWFANLTGFQIAALFGVALALWGLERVRQTWLKRRKSPPIPSVPPLLRPSARRFERALKKRGLVLANDRPWSESVPPDWVEGREFVELYNRARFGPDDASATEKLKSHAEKLD